MWESLEQQLLLKFILPHGHVHLTLKITSKVILPSDQTSTMASMTWYLHLHLTQVQVPCHTGWAPSRVSGKEPTALEGAGGPDDKSLRQET